MTETRSGSMRNQHGRLSSSGLPSFSRASTLLPGVALAFAVVGSLVAGSPAGPAAAGSSARGVVKHHHLRGEIDADVRGQRRRHLRGAEGRYNDGGALRGRERDRQLLSHDRDWLVAHPQAVTSYALQHPEWAANHTDMVEEASDRAYMTEELGHDRKWISSNPRAARDYAQQHPEWAAIHRDAIAEVSISFAAAHPEYAQEIADVLAEIEELKEGDGDTADLEGDLEELAEEMIEKGAAGAYDAGPDLLDVVRDEVVAELVAAVEELDAGDEGEGLAALAEELIEEEIEEELGNTEGGSRERDRRLITHDSEWLATHPGAVTRYADEHPEWAASHNDEVEEAYQKGQLKAGDGSAPRGSHDHEWLATHPGAVTRYADQHPEWAASHKDTVAEAYQTAELGHDSEWIATHPVPARDYAQQHPEWAAIHKDAIRQASIPFAAAHPEYAQEIADVLAEIEELKEADGDTADLEGDLEELAEEMIEKGAAGEYDAGSDLLDVVREEVVSELVAAATGAGDEGEGLAALANELETNAGKRKDGKKKGGN